MPKKSRLDAVDWGNVQIEKLDKEAADVVQQYRYRPTTVDRTYQAWTAYKTFLNNCPDAFESNGGKRLPIAEGTMKRFITMMAGLGFKQLYTIYFQGLNRVTKMHGLPKIEYGPAISALCAALDKKNKINTKHTTPLMVDDVYHIISCMRPGVSYNARDAAILLVDVALGKRASSLFALQLRHLEFVKEGESVRIECRFTVDKVLKEPHVLSITQHPEKAKDPVYALLTEGEFEIQEEAKDWPVFCQHTHNGYPMNDVPLSRIAISRMVMSRAEDAGYPAKLFSGHSLRAGMATSFVIGCLEKNGGVWTDDMWTMLARMGGWTTRGKSEAQGLYVSRTLDKAIDTTAVVAKLKRDFKVPEGLKKHPHDKKKIKREWPGLPDTILHMVYDSLKDQYRTARDELIELNTKCVKLERSIRGRRLERLCEWNWKEGEELTPDEETLQWKKELTDMRTMKQMVYSAVRNVWGKAVHKYLEQWAEDNCSEQVRLAYEEDEELKQRIAERDEFVKLNPPHRGRRVIDERLVVKESPTIPQPDESACDQEIDSAAAEVLRMEDGNGRRSEIAQICAEGDEDEHEDTKAKTVTKRKRAKKNSQNTQQCKRSKITENEQSDKNPPRRKSTRTTEMTRLNNNVKSRQLSICLAVARPLFEQANATKPPY